MHDIFVRYIKQQENGGILMTKLILSSTNPSNKILTLNMYMIFRKINLKHKKILYISCDTPNAVIKTYCHSVLGFPIHNIFSIDDGLPAGIPEYVLVDGRNSYELLTYLKGNSLYEYIIDIVANGSTYIGFGAGAALAGNDIIASSYCYANYSFPSDLTAFGFVDGCVLPHVDDPGRFLLVSESNAYNYNCFYAIPDNIAIKINENGEVENGSIYMYKPSQYRV